ncbi:TPA: hypothetical protein ACH3X1_016070 [Trebouxia sp. C0004]
MCCQASPRSPISRSLITVKITNTVVKVKHIRHRLHLTITQTVQHFTSRLSQLQLRNKLPQARKLLCHSLERHCRLCKALVYRGLHSKIFVNRYVDRAFYDDNKA